MSTPSTVRLGPIEGACLHPRIGWARNRNNWFCPPGPDVLQTKAQSRIILTYHPARFFLPSPTTRRGRGTIERVRERERECSQTDRHETREQRARPVPSPDRAIDDGYFLHWMFANTFPRHWYSEKRRTIHTRESERNGSRISVGRWTVETEEKFRQGGQI